ncbi:MAG TPA: Gmad2 immunoglobulin-like domain-containing protein [Actinomycetota bacterium]|nr:Gmad2 immunoglobulin-like domain-containing protein [Actinomycetota bacterium]
MANDKARTDISRAGIALGVIVLVALGAAAAITLTRGGEDGPRPETAATTPRETIEPTPRPSETVQETIVEVPPTEQELWFVQDERLSWGATVVGGTLPRGVAPDDRVAQKAAFWIGMLLDGPTAPDREVGATTAIPRGTDLLRVQRENGVLLVDLSSRFESGGGSLSMQLRVAQVVYTATQFEGVERVRILIEGEEVEAIGGEGVIVSEPLSRRDFKDFAPPIVVEEPRPGAEFRSGDIVSGFANVFEANVSLRLRDANGKVLVKTFTTATCGTGCWGDFEKALEFEVTEAQDGRLEVLTYSAEDGSPQHTISLPVKLVP